jgi:5-formyltetrahydrofolate cyclo-ligase
LTAVPIDPPNPVRAALRARLRAERETFASSPAAEAARIALAKHLGAVLSELEPMCLGLYWPVRSEFNAAQALAADAMGDRTPWALPYAQRVPREMHYRMWDRQPPPLLDECRIPSCEGAPVVPDVVLVPCVGFTRAGYRLGYGGGYFDRWLAAHPHATTVGVAWAVAEIDPAGFEPELHDRPLALILTEHGVVQA